MYNPETKVTMGTRHRTKTNKREKKHNTENYNDKQSPNPGGEPIREG